MNDNPTRNSPVSAAQPGQSADAVSRRAYELWERDGRPEGKDLLHWLQAEQELIAEPPKAAARTSETDVAPSTETGNMRPQGTDTEPLQGTRAAAAVARGTPQVRRSGGTAQSPGGKHSRSGSRGRS